VKLDVGYFTIHFGVAFLVEYKNRWEYILFILAISLILSHSNPKLRLLDAEIYLLLWCHSVYWMADILN